MKPTAPIWHCGTPAGHAPPIPRAAARRSAEVSRGIPILQPSAPLVMGYFSIFGEPTPSQLPPPFPSLDVCGNQCLSALGDLDMLHHHGLFATASYLLQRQEGLLIDLHHARSCV